jgi:hypothetical protein
MRLHSFIWSTGEVKKLKGLYNVSFLAPCMERRGKNNIPAPDEGKRPRFNAADRDCIYIKEAFRGFDLGLIYMADVEGGNDWDFKDFKPATLMPKRFSRFLFELKKVSIIDRNDLYKKDFEIAQFGFSGRFKGLVGEWSTPSGKLFSSREAAIDDYLKEKRFFPARAPYLYVIETEKNPNIYMLKQYDKSKDNPINRLKEYEKSKDKGLKC